ncbi:hypothetical protein [Bradyrhizobium sp. WSM1743]|uniref:hypothetical protein n=1 Tax=Bradyrhizobium sp. WSM1743 TaxID=318996 RepID=UPI0012EB1E4D
MLDADADRADLELRVIWRRGYETLRPLRRDYVEAFTDVLADLRHRAAAAYAERARRFDDRLRLRQMSRQVTAITMTVLIRSGARPAADDRSRLLLRRIQDALLENRLLQLRWTPHGDPHGMSTCFSSVSH